MIHETPIRFGKQYSGAVMGLQMAFAYVRSTFGPPILGVISTKTSIAIFPYFLLVCIVIMFVTSELLKKKINQT